MNNFDSYKNTPSNTITNLHEGQKIIYNGKEAFVIQIKPVVVIKLKDKNEVICGNVLNAVSYA